MINLLSVKLENDNYNGNVTYLHVVILLLTRIKISE